MSEKIYRVALIGCGRVAWLLDEDPLIRIKPVTHAGAYRKVKKTRLVAAADIREDRVRAFCSAYNVKGRYHDYIEMLEKEKPDIVSICAYAPQRYEMVVNAVNAGVKGIWCEKAFGTSLIEADKMVDLCEEKGVTLILSYMRRWGTDYHLAKKLINEGNIGMPVSAVSHFSGNLLHTGTHAFDVLRFLLGDAKWVQGVLDGDGIVSHHKAFQSTKNLLSYDCGGYALICFKNGAYVNVHGNSKNYFMFEFDIIGTEGRLRIGNWLFELYKAEESRTESGLTELYKQNVRFRNKNFHVEALKHLIDCMEGKTENICGPEDGRAALEIALAIHQSMRDGVIIDLPLKDRSMRVINR